MLSSRGAIGIGGRAEQPGLNCDQSGMISWINVWVRDDLAGHCVPDLHSRLGPAYALYKHRTSCERCGQGW